MEEKMTRVSAPWDEYHRKMVAFFDHDPDVEVYELEPEGGGYVLPIGVTCATKAFALQNTLAQRTDFGGVTVCLRIRCDEVPDVVETAFSGNELLHEITTDSFFGGTATFVELEPVALQFFNDDISHPFGMSALLAQDVARDIFRVYEHGAFICTATKKD